MYFFFSSVSIIAFLDAGDLGRATGEAGMKGELTRKGGRGGRRTTGSGCAIQWGDTKGDEKGGPDDVLRETSVGRGRDRERTMDQKTGTSLRLIISCNPLKRQHHLRIRHASACEASDRSSVFGLRSQAGVSFVLRSSIAGKRQRWWSSRTRLIMLNAILPTFHVISRWLYFLGLDDACGLLDGVGVGVGVSEV
ncbi:hypothetical protein B0H19DRAFT_1289579 [Mycena capillaripes]|nr:hypothetical protein B0H19DRAFT_1289579 [Mycena capillaripes]